MRMKKRQVSEMKESKLAYLICGIFMILVILVICMLSIRSVNEGGPIMVLADQGELRNAIEIPLSEASDISVIYTSDNIKIYPAEENVVVIKEYLSSRREDALATVSIEDGKATVIGGRRDPLNFRFWMSVNERIEIYLPKEGMDYLGIQVSSGNITTEEIFSINAKTVDIEAKSGNVRWQDTVAENIDVETSSGNLRIDKIQADTLKFTAKSGNVAAHDISGRAEITASSGNVTVTGFEGEGEISTQSGNIKAETDKVTGDISLEAGSGNVKLTVPQELAFEVEINTGSGNINTDYDENISYNKEGNHAAGVVGTEAVVKLLLKAGSGNVSLKTT